MKKVIILFLTISISILNSCNSQNKEIKINKDKDTQNTGLIGTWLFVVNNDNKYVYCTDISKSIIVNKTSIIEHTPMEDSEFKIDHIKQKNDLIYIYLDKKETSFYKFKWIDKEKKIAKWIFNNYEGDVYVNKLSIDKIKKIKCEEVDKPKGLQCEIANLSNIYDFKISGTDFENKDKNLNPLIAEISIIQKAHPNKIQKIRFEPSSWVLFSEVPCNAISYFEKKESIKENIENHHNFIIADYNFDGLEDFAYVWDNGGNGGPLYSFYFQNNVGEFLEATDFPMQNGPFPSEINSMKKAITIRTPIGCCKSQTTIYNLKENGKWIVSSAEVKELNKI